MSILLAKTAQENIANSKLINPLSLIHIISIMESINQNNIESENRVHRIHDSKNEIYVLRENDLRVFFTKKDEDIIILSTINNQIDSYNTRES